MNLVSAFSQIDLFSFGLSRSSSEFLFKNQDELIPTQKDKLLKVEEINPKKKDNLFVSEELQAIIGENGKHRFDEFKTYPEGWYGGKGKKLSKRSVFFLEQFVNYLPELKLFRPSLFMTLKGNLSIGFEDKKGDSVEIEFFSDKAEYYLESLEEENIIKLADIFELVRKIRTLLK